MVKIEKYNEIQHKPAVHSVSDHGKCRLDKHHKNLVTWKLKFKCQFCLSCLSSTMIIISTVMAISTTMTISTMMVAPRSDQRKETYRDNLQLICVQYSTSGKITSKFLTQRKQCGNKRTAKENSVEILKWLLICSPDLRGFVRKVRLWPLIG